MYVVVRFGKKKSRSYFYDEEELGAYLRKQAKNGAALAFCDRPNIVCEDGQYLFYIRSCGVA